MASQQQEENGAEDNNSKWLQTKKLFQVNRPLVPLKLAMLFYYGISTLVMPYMTLLMIQIGLQLEEIAIIYAVLPFLTSIMPALAGLLADRFNCYKLVLCCLIASSAVFHTSLLYVNARVPNEVVTQFEVAQLHCSPTGTILHFDNSSAHCMKAEKGVLQIPASYEDCQTDCFPNRFCLDGNCTEFGRDSNGTSLNVQLVQDGGDCYKATIVTTTLLSNDSGLDCDCPIRCSINVTLEGNRTAPSNEEDRSNRKRAFWVYFILRMAAASAGTASLSILDSTAICMVKKHNGDLGKQRLFGVIGQSLFGMLASVLLDWTVRLKGFPDYSAPFYLGDILSAAVILLVCRLDVEMGHPPDTKNLRISLKHLARLIDVNFFLLMMLLLGSCWGFLESFLFVFLAEMQASSYVLGLTVTLGCVIGVPFLYVSDTIIHRFGSANVIVLAFLFYCIRFVSYSLLWDPWLCLPFEALEAVTIHMMAVASSTYCADAAPPGLLATLNGVVGSIHYSFGRGVGSLVGGMLIATHGTRPAFRIFGLAAGISGIVYFLIYHLYLVKLERNRMTQKKEQKNQQEADWSCGMKKELEEEPMLVPRS